MADTSIETLSILRNCVKMGDKVMSELIKYSKLKGLIRSAIVQPNAVSNFLREMTCLLK